MAWAVKPSGTMQIARRKEPWVTPAMRAKYEREVLPRYQTKMGALMPILHDVQHAHGWISHQAMEEIAAFLGLAPADVLDTASFYEEFRMHPVGACVVGVCQSIACEVCGHSKILDHLREKLGIEPHETTADGKFTLLTMECLGSCDTAPVMLVNETLHEKLTIEQVDRIVDEAGRAAGPKAAHHH